MRLVLTCKLCDGDVYDQSRESFINFGAILLQKPLDVNLRRAKHIECKRKTLTWVVMYVQKCT